MQKWQKISKVFSVDGISDWMHTHAMMPCVVPHSRDYVQIYFSPRDILGRSRPASVLLNPETLQTKGLSTSPLLDLGPREPMMTGVMPTCIYNIGVNTYMSFNGWCLGKNIPFYSFNGLAIKKGNTFMKLSSYPNLLNRSESDPFSTFAPFILCVKGEWFMWYVSLIKWEDSKHFYHIKLAKSLDGISWHPENTICIDFRDSFEYAIARPVVIFENNIFKMWFSSRASESIKTYRISYAESIDGIHWIRMDDEVDLDVSSNETWDSSMICYGYVFDHNESRYMLYNGNNYGKTGFGLAVLNR